MNENKVSQNINNIVNDNIQALAQLFPSSVKDGEFDIEALKEELGQFEEVSEEKYELTWSGKKEAKKRAQEDVINRTLQYVEKDSLHPETTGNLYIEGDNLEVLKLLRQNYYGAIKMIYIDPPYNTGNDFVYNDKFSMDKKTSDIAEGMADTDGNPLQKNQQSSNRYHANWLNMMYPRLKIAKDLLTDDGVIFISINHKETHNMRKICDEILGAENFVGELTWESTTQPINSGSARFGLQSKTESIYLYAKNKQLLSQFKLEKIESGLSYPHNGVHGKCRFEIIEKSDAGNYNRPSMKFNILGRSPREGKRWQIGEDTAKELEAKGKIEIIDGIVKKAVYPEDEIDKESFKPFWSLLTAEKYGTAQSGKEELNTILNAAVGFDTVKSVSLIQYLLSIVTDENDFVLDFFAGSSTTSHAVLQLNTEDLLKGADMGNRKFIMVQYPEIVTKDDNEATYSFLKQLNKPKNICEIGKERIRRAGKKILEDNKGKEGIESLDVGFKVFRTADTNIKWNLRDTISAMKIESSNPDTVDFTDNATDIDVVYEIMLRQRDVPLSEKIETLETIGKRTYLYASSYLICLETEITAETIEKLASLDPLPIKFVFRDSAFKDDINLKDETFRRLALLVERNTGEKKTTYTVEFI